MEKSKPVRIFLVEDDAVYSAIISTALRLQGFEVETYQLGEHMISAWEEDPDIIVLDYNLESELGVAMNGEKILRFIRRISKSLPVIMLTGDEALKKNITKATRLLKTGAVDFIVKGKDEVPNLLKTISQVQEARKIREELARNRMVVKKYRQHFFIIVLLVALAAMTVLWLFS